MNQKKKQIKKKNTNWVKRIKKDKKTKEEKKKDKKLKKEIYYKKKKGNSWHVTKNDKTEKKQTKGKINK